MNYDYTCHNDECEHEFEVCYTPPTPNRYMNGRFEDAEQGSYAKVYPQECPECGEEVDVDEVGEACED